MSKSPIKLADNCIKLAKSLSILAANPSTLTNVARNRENLIENHAKSAENMPNMTEKHPDMIGIPAKHIRGMERSHHDLRERRQSRRDEVNMLLSEQQLSDIHDLLKKGVPKTKIAKRYGIGVSTLYRYLSLPDNQLEVKLAASHKIAEVKILHDMGVTKTRIAKDLGISVRTVHRYLSSLKAEDEQKKAPVPASKTFTHTSGTSKEQREARKREIEQLISEDIAALQPSLNDD